MRAARGPPPTPAWRSDRVSFVVSRRISAPDPFGRSENRPHGRCVYGISLATVGATEAHWLPGFCGDRGRGQSIAAHTVHSLHRSPLPHSPVATLPGVATISAPLFAVHVGQRCCRGMPQGICVLAMPGHRSNDCGIRTGNRCMVPSPVRTEAAPTTKGTNHARSSDHPTRRTGRPETD